MSAGGITNSQLITIKVDLSCCHECVQRMKRLLQSVKGVESMSIDVKSGTVIVSGHIDQPHQIVHKIRKKGKHVTFYSIQSNNDYDQQPIISSKPDKQCNEIRNQDSGEYCTSRLVHKCGGQSKPHVCQLNENNNFHDTGRHGGSRIVDGDESWHFCAGDGDQTRCFYAGAGVEINSGHRHHGHADCDCNRWHLHDPPSWSFSDLHGPPHRVVHHEAAHSFNSKPDFDSLHYIYTHYPEMMSHYQRQIPRQQFQTDPMDFVTHFFSDDNPLGCCIM